MCPSRSPAEPWGEEHRTGEREMLLFLLAGPTLHREREGDVSPDDGGAGWGEGSSGRIDQNTDHQSIRKQSVPTFYKSIRKPPPPLMSFMIHVVCYRFRCSRGRSLLVSFSASTEGWSSMLAKGRRRRRTLRVIVSTLFPHVINYLQVLICKGGDRAEGWSVRNIHWFIIF